MNTLKTPAEFEAMKYKCLDESYDWVREMPPKEWIKLSEAYAAAYAETVRLREALELIATSEAYHRDPKTTAHVMSPCPAVASIAKQAEYALKGQP